MGGIILWKYCAGLALFSSPAFPLFFAWRWLLAGDRLRRLDIFVPTAVASLSLIWFDAAVADFRFIGPIYGLLRFAVTGGNFVANLLCALFCLILSFRRGARRARLITCFACLMLAAEWGLLGIAYR